MGDNRKPSQGRTKGYRKKRSKYKVTYAIHDKSLYEVDPNIAGLVFDKNEMFEVDLYDSHYYNRNFINDFFTSNGELNTLARRERIDNKEDFSASTELFSTDLPDIESFIKELDMFDENVNNALRTGLHEAGNLICQAQKRLIKSKPASTAEGKYKRYNRESKHRLKRLSEAIKTGRVYATRDGALGITSGYQADAFETDSDGFNPGTVGMVTEFGRPGHSQQRTYNTMVQVRNGEKVEIDKGTIQPYSHIRRGFDSVKEQAAQKLIDAYNAEIDKLGD